MDHFSGYSCHSSSVKARELNGAALDLAWVRAVPIGSPLFPREQNDCRCSLPQSVSQGEQIFLVLRVWKAWMSTLERLESCWFARRCCVPTAVAPCGNGEDAFKPSCGLRKGWH